MESLEHISFTGGLWLIAMFFVYIVSFIYYLKLLVDKYQIGHNHNNV